MNHLDLLAALFGTFLIWGLLIERRWDKFSVRFYRHCRWRTARRVRGRLRALLSNNLKPDIGPIMPVEDYEALGGDKRHQDMRDAIVFAVSMTKDALFGSAKVEHTKEEV